MTRDEARALLGPEVCARIDAFVATAPPLTEAQKTLLGALFAIEEPPAAADSDVA